MPRARSKKGRSGQPVRAASGQEYGQRKAQEEAQKAVPVAAAAPVPAAPAGPDMAPQGPLPGSFGAFSRPTERPGEPPTTGIGMGPGPGPEALAMSRFGKNPDLEGLAAYLPTFELMASRPNASPSTRNFVRRLRGALGTANLRE